MCGVETQKITKQQRKTSFVVPEILTVLVKDDLFFSSIEESFHRQFKMQCYSLKQLVRDICGSMLFALLRITLENGYQPSTPWTRSMRKQLSRSLLLVAQMRTRVSKAFDQHLEISTV
jgi:hypothetical protein